MGPRAASLWNLRAGRRMSTPPWRISTFYWCRRGVWKACRSRSWRPSPRVSPWLRFGREASRRSWTTAVPGFSRIRLRKWPNPRFRSSRVIPRGGVRLRRQLASAGRRALRPSAGSGRCSARSSASRHTRRSARETRSDTKAAGAGGSRSAPRRASHRDALPPRLDADGDGLSKLLYGGARYPETRAVALVLRLGVVPAADPLRRHRGQLGGYVPYTPLTMLPVLPLAAFPPQRAKQIWLALEIMLLVATIVVLARLSRLGILEVAVLGLLAHSGNFQLGQDYILILFLVACG